MAADWRKGKSTGYVSAALLAYGTLGVLVHLRFVPLLAEGVSGWAGLRSASNPSITLGWLSPLQGHYDALPWLPWAAWLAGIGLLGFTGVRQTARRAQGPAAGPGDMPLTPRMRWLPLVVLLALLLVGGYARMAELWPQSYGISQQPYDDEGVYAGASQLFLQGIVPYRDYFFAHPPLAAISYAPAMAYHFTEWGSPTSFMMARYLSVAYSLVTLALLFFVGQRLSGLWGSVAAGALWALDGRVVEINRKVMLDGPMVLLSCAAILLYLWARPTLAGEANGRPLRRTLLILAAAGICAMLSALTKIAGVACLIAIMSDMVWLTLELRRRSMEPATPPPRLQFLSIAAGAIAAALVVLGPFMLLAPSQFVRMVLFFQLLRPSDGLIEIPARIADLSSKLGNALTLLSAAAGFVILSLWLWRRGHAGPWRPLALWTFFSVLLFTYSRSFYGHYYIQLAAPLCLLGAGVGLGPDLVRQFLNNAPSRRVSMRRAGIAAGLVSMLVALPLFAVEWLGSTAQHGDHDRIFELVGRYVNDAVKPGTPVLSSDEQFNILAARPPSHTATGYLVDSYGHMIYLALGLGTRSWGELLLASARGEHSNDAYAVIRSPIPQADMLDRAARVPLVVLHDKGFTRLTDASIAQIEKQGTAIERQARYTVYRMRQ